MFCIGWFGRTFNFLLSWAVLSTLQIYFHSNLEQGAVAANLFIISVPGHFLIYFQANPASQQKFDTEKIASHSVHCTLLQAV